MFTVVALGPVTCQTNGTGSQLTTVNKKRIIVRQVDSYSFTTVLPAKNDRDFTFYLQLSRA